MPKPLSQGPDAIRGDIINLTRCLDRVRTDPKRRGKDREKLIECLQMSLILLVRDKRTSEPVRKMVEGMFPPWSKTA